MVCGTVCDAVCVYISISMIRSALLSPRLVYQGHGMTLKLVGCSQTYLSKNTC